jgi:uncharacterized protein
MLRFVNKPRDEQRRLYGRRWKPSLLFGVLLSASFGTAAPAQAQVRLGPEAAGGANYTVQVMTWWDIPFRSIVRQRYDFSCGSAAVATLLTYHYDMPTTEQAPFKAMWDAGDRAKITKAGFSMYDMKLYLQSIGLASEGYRMDINDLRKAKRPGIALIDLNGYKHFVVIKGVIGDSVLVGDPMRGIARYDTATFSKMWNGIVLAVSKTPANVRARYNLARDWNPWATAPTNAYAQVAAIGDLTTHLPPDYQVTTEFLIDARVGTVR